MNHEQPHKIKLKLHACPFCSSKAGLKAILVQQPVQHKRYYVACLNTLCAAEGPTLLQPVAAVKRWNRRPKPGQAEPAPSFAANVTADADPITEACERALGIVLQQKDLGADIARYTEGFRDGWQACTEIIGPLMAQQLQPAQEPDAGELIEEIEAAGNGPTANVMECDECPHHAHKPALCDISHCDC